MNRHSPKACLPLRQKEGLYPHSSGTLQLEGSFSPSNRLRGHSFASPPQLHAPQVSMAFPAAMCKSAEAKADDRLCGTIPQADSPSRVSVQGAD
ncbi:hypothetical protein DUNSADRAFT_3618 [Dunaliella salina]|uniref:Encoded protein n=1 Tax=Dunaliella salina TaxID=3046 RepID=A0ABQ7GTN3_DUNSA|nr:hypothetical protein DUNSADRAFT_3618 [Dunaliella salina]|eukprot:KAF5837957.1 hypothetical protein DUNSADRAFT_3618 [Dunaliella salina]